MPKPTEEQITNFMADIVEVCRKHNLLLTHEDGHGNFMIEPFDEQTLDWLKAAYWNPNA